MFRGAFPMIDRYIDKSYWIIFHASLLAAIYLWMVPAFSSNILQFTEQPPYFAPYFCPFLFYFLALPILVFQKQKNHLQDLICNFMVSTVDQHCDSTVCFLSCSEVYGDGFFNTSEQLECLETFHNALAWSQMAEEISFQYTETRELQANRKVSK